MNPYGITPFRAALVLAGFSALLAGALVARILLWGTPTQAVQQAVHNFTRTLVKHHRRYGYLPGDADRDGEIESAIEETIDVDGRRITLRAIARRLSATAGASLTRNVIELRNLPCAIARDMDGRVDCVPGSGSDPVPLIALPVPQSQE